MAKTACEQIRLPATKRKPKLGQNFLTDLGAARRIVEALGDVSNRTVIEIGPGAVCSPMCWLREPSA